MDLMGYSNFMAGKLIDYPLPEEELQESLKSLEGLPKPVLAKTGRW
jgi:hypothetical protein